MLNVSTKKKTKNDKFQLFEILHFMRNLDRQMKLTSDFSKSQLQQNKIKTLKNGK